MKRTLAALMLFASTAVAAETPRVYIEAAETVDAGNSKDKAKQIDFGSAIAAALVKKQVPVAVVTDNTKSQCTIRTVSSQKEDTTGTKVAKLLLWGGWWLHEVRGSHSGHRQ